MNLKKTTLIVMVITFVTTSLNVIKYLSVVLGEGQLRLFDYVSWTSSLLSSAGLCVFLFVFYKNLKSKTEGLNEAMGTSSKEIEGKGGRHKNKWEFDWVSALVGMGVAGLFLGMLGKKYIIAGTMSGDGGEFAISVGLVIVIMVGIIVGYGVKLIKRK